MICTVAHGTASMPLRAGSAAAACTLPQGPHTPVLDPRLVADANTSDLQHFIARQVLAAARVACLFSRAMTTA